MLRVRTKGYLDLYNVRGAKHAPLPLPNRVVPLAIDSALHSYCLFLFLSRDSSTLELTTTTESSFGENLSNIWKMYFVSCLAIVF